MSWGSWTGSGAYLHVLDYSTGKLSTGDNNRWRIAVGIENPTINLNGGYYYLFGSKETCCNGVNSTYYAVVGRSAGITGPYLDQNGTDMASGGGTTVLTGACPKVAAGGADAYDDGSSKFLAYHYYDGNNSGQETLGIRQVTFWRRLARQRRPTRSGEQPPAEPQQNQVRGRLVPKHGGRRGRELGELQLRGHQLWVATAVSSNYELVNVKSGKCLQISGASTADGAVAVQSTCTGASQQLWTKAAVIGGYVTCANVNSGKCLEVAGASTANGAALDQSRCKRRHEPAVACRLTARRADS
ncbi:RICIN domain-containing protein [Streptomyces sp. NPDC096311]|uniref:RICIN domain-containing protein n=1 Tax=Streptomyces sp. NPDC096311 TaxID=3366083 RepID=UPI003818F9CE